MSYYDVCGIWGQVTPERLLHSFSLLLTHRIPRMPRGPLINSTGAVGIVLRHMRGDVHPSEFPHQFLGVIVLVPTQSYPFPAGDRLRPSASQHLVPLFHVASVRNVCTKSPLRFSINTCPR